MLKQRHKLFTDGGARGNPGPAAIGGVLLSPNGGSIAEFSLYIGHTTNNYAEYSALLEGLKLTRTHGIKEIYSFSDSELVVEQINGRYKVKDQKLAKVFMEIQILRHQFSFFSCEHIPRSKNHVADRLVNKALDQFLG